MKGIGLRENEKIAIYKNFTYHKLILANFFVANFTKLSTVIKTKGHFGRMGSMHKKHEGMHVGIGRIISPGEYAPDQTLDF